MPGYADSLLTRGEVVAVRGRQHILATIVDGRRAWGLLVLAIALLVVGTRLTGDVQLWTGYAGYALLALSLLWLAIRYWDWLNQEYLVTNRRVIKVEGIINKRSADSSLEKINDAVLDQNLFGRIFGYADLDILTAADQAIDKFRMLNQALAFKRAMLEQKHELELELGRAPAVRVADPDSEPERGASRPAAGVATGGGPSPLVRSAPGADDTGRRSMTADEIMAAIDDLANLRDRGAISTEQFEAKKADLLARL
jgi:uncharacterized membrane protein YdbT with pleckstrin-like domain